MSKNKKDIIVSVFLMFFCLIAYYFSLFIKKQGRIYPQIIIFCIFFLSMMLCINVLRNKDEIKREDTAKNKIIYSNLITIGISMLIYIYLLDKMGFYSSTILFLVFTMVYLLGLNKKYLVLIIVSVFTLLI